MFLAETAVTADADGSGAFTGGRVATAGCGRIHHGHDDCAFQSFRTANQSHCWLTTVEVDDGFLKNELATATAEDRELIMSILLR